MQKWLLWQTTLFTKNPPNIRNIFGQNNKYDIAKSWNFVQAYEYEDHISTFWLFPTFNKEDSDGTANSDPEAMQQKSLRMPLVVTGIGLQEQAEHNVTETESTTNFTEKHGEQFISLFGHFGVFVLHSFCFISNDFLTSLFLKKINNGLVFFQKIKQHWVK